MSGYDPKCYELAEHFIGFEPELERLRIQMAQHIQDSCEDFLEVAGLTPDKAPLKPKGSA